MRDGLHVSTIFAAFFLSLLVGGLSHFAFASMDGENGIQNNFCADGFSGSSEFKAHIDFLNGATTADLRTDINKLEENIRKILGVIEEKVQRIVKHEKDSKRLLFFLYPLLTAAELQKIREHILQLKKEIELKEEKIKAVINVLSRLNAAGLKASLQNQKLKPYIIEKLKLMRVESIKKSQAVTLAFGNPHSNPDPHLVQEVKSLVKGLLELNYQIIFDADSTLAPVISELAGAHGLGVAVGSARYHLKSPVVSFTNPYHKFIALRHSRVQIGDPTSAASLALYFTHDLHFMLDPSQSWVSGIDQWKGFLEWNNIDLGLKVPRVEKIPTASNLLNYQIYDSKNDSYVNLFSMQKKRKANAFIPLQKLTFDQLERIREYVKTMAIDADPINEIRGAVLFASSGLHERYVDGAYYTAYLLSSRGVAVRTGGSGGLMLAANMGAYDAGGMSVGIPRIAGVLKTENTFPIEYHDKTIFTPDYACRIGLLLQNVDLVMLHPGRDGTMRELGIALMNLSAGGSNATIAFYNQDFWGPFYDWLANQNQATKGISDKIKIFSDLQQVSDEIDDVGKSQNKQTLHPRSIRHAFPGYDFEMEGPWL